MSTPVVVLQAVAIVALLVSAAETFRARPWWPHAPTRPVERGPGKGTSPRERRWIHAGLALLLLGNLLAGLVGGDTPWWWAVLALLVIGLGGVVVGLVRGPTAAERERFAGEHGLAGPAEQEPGDEGR